MSDITENDVDISQVLAELAKGEMAASALENHLNAIEGKVEELLAGIGDQDTPLPNSDTKDQEPETNEKADSSPETKSR